MIEDLADDSRERVATGYIEDLIKGDHSVLVSALDPTLRKGNEMTLMAQMRSLFPAGEPRAKNLVGCHLFQSSSAPTQVSMTYQYGYDDMWLVISVVFREVSTDRTEIVGLNVQPLPRSLQETNRYTLGNKGPVHYAFLLCCLAVPAFVLTTVVVCLRTRIERRKWLWVIFILVPVVRFSINWTTGQIGFQPISLQLFGAGVVASNIYSPWFLSFSLPLGAVLFWAKRASWRRRASASDGRVTRSADHDLR